MIGRRISDDQHPTRVDEPTVTLDGVDVLRGRTKALSDGTFELHPGTLTAVVGPNGAGKSSLFALISGRVHQTRGDVSVRGPVAEVLQSTQLDDELPLTVNDVVRLGRYPTTGLLRPIRRHDRQVIDEVWQLYTRAVQRIDALPTLIEWDSDIPEWPVLFSEAQRAEQILSSLLPEPAAGCTLATDQPVSHELA